MFLKEPRLLVTSDVQLRAVRERLSGCPRPDVLAWAVLPFCSSRLSQHESAQIPEWHSPPPGPQEKALGEESAPNHQMKHRCPLAMLMGWLSSCAPSGAEALFLLPVSFASEGAVWHLLGHPWGLQAFMLASICDGHSIQI